MIRSRSARLFPPADFLLCSRRCDSGGWLVVPVPVLYFTEVSDYFLHDWQTQSAPNLIKYFIYLYIFLYCHLKKCRRPVRLKNLRSDGSDRSQCHPVCCNTSHMVPAGGAGPPGPSGGGGGPGAPSIIWVKPLASFLSTRAVWRKTRPTKQWARPLSSSGLSVSRGAPGPLSPLMGIELIISNNIIVLEQPKEQRNPPSTTEEEKRRGAIKEERERGRGGFNLNDRKFIRELCVCVCVCVFVLCVCVCTVSVCVCVSSLITSRNIINNETFYSDHRNYIILKYYKCINITYKYY